MNRIFLITCIGLIALSCAEAHKADKSPTQPTTQVTPPSQFLADYEVKSFKDLPVEKRCDGIGEFFEFIVKKSLDPKVVLVETDRLAQKEKFDCHSIGMYPFASDNYLRYFNVTAGGNQITFSIYIKTASSAFVSEVGSVKVTSSVYNSDFRYLEKDFGPNISSLELTTRNWINEFSTSTWTFLGKSLHEFINDQTTRHSINGEPFQTFVKRFDRVVPELALELGLDMSRRSISFQFDPSITGAYTGIVKFTSASPEVFRVADSGAIHNAPYLGCMSLQCLQELTVVYEFYGTSLYLTATDSYMKARYTEFIYSFESRDPPTIVKF